MKRSTLLARQGRMPTGLLGQIVARIMARETHAANLIALEALELAPEDRVLEVGFGHGRTLATAAKIVTKGRLAGVDPSDVMLRIARKRNAAAIRAGRMELKPGMSAHLPLADAVFNKALAVHTIYFWQHPERDLAEIHRVLAPGGRLVLGFRSSEDETFVQSFPPEIYHIRSLAEVERLVASAGFADVRTVSRRMGKAVVNFLTTSKS